MGADRGTPRGAVPAGGFHSRPSCHCPAGGHRAPTRLLLLLLLLALPRLAMERRKTGSCVTGREEAAGSVEAARTTRRQRPGGSCDVPELMSARSPRSAPICFHFKPVLQSGLGWDLYAFYVAYTTHCAS